MINENSRNRTLYTIILFALFGSILIFLSINFTCAIPKLCKLKNTYFPNTIKTLEREISESIFYKNCKKYNFPQEKGLDDIFKNLVDVSPGNLTINSTTKKINSSTNFDFKIKPLIQYEQDNEEEEGKNVLAINKICYKIEVIDISKDITFVSYQKANGLYETHLIEEGQ